jgi:hypothetical protein
MQSTTHTPRRVAWRAVPQPWWLSLPILAGLCLVAYVFTGASMELARVKARERQAHKALVQQQLEATQAPTEEVRRLRQTLEGQR